MNRFFRQPQRSPFGILVDAGTVAPIIDLDGSIEMCRHLVGSDLDHVASEEGLIVVRSSKIDPGGLCNDPPIIVVDTFDQVIDPKLCQREWHKILTAGRSVSMIIRSSQSRDSVWWLLFGYGLPAFGQLKGCLTKDVIATWLALVGMRCRVGDCLIMEKDSPFSEEADRSLHNRLRQLYGQ